MNIYLTSYLRLFPILTLLCVSFHLKAQDTLSLQAYLEEADQLIDLRKREAVLDLYATALTQFEAQQNWESYYAILFRKGRFIFQESRFEDFRQIFADGLEFYQEILGDSLTMQLGELYRYLGICAAILNKEEEGDRLVNKLWMFLRNWKLRIELH